MKKKTIFSIIFALVIILASCTKNTNIVINPGPVQDSFKVLYNDWTPNYVTDSLWSGYTFCAKHYVKDCYHNRSDLQASIRAISWTTYIEFHSFSVGPFGGDTIYIFSPNQDSLWFKVKMP